MKLVSFNFNKINVEKKKSDLKDLKINSSINVNSIDEIKSSNNKDSFLKIDWAYSLNYDPEIALFNFAGSLVINEDKKKIKEILKKWEDKKVDPELNMVLLNFIMKKVSIKALQFEDEFNLPTHFKMPSLKKK